MGAGFDDADVARLERLFAEHPAWCAAAAHLKDGTGSAVYFSHLPGEPWHLVRRGGHTHLQRGPCSDPDFAFRFSPAAIERLEGTSGEIADVALTLFELILEPKPEHGVGFRVVAPFWRLALHGYIRLLLAAGPRVIAYGARQGVGDLGNLAKRVAEARRQTPYDWES